VFSGRDILLKQLLNEAEFEESRGQQSFSPVTSSTPKIDKKSSKTKFRKRKLESVDTCTESLFEVSKRLDKLLSNSRQMNDDLKKVRQDLDVMELNLGRVSDDCKKTKSEFRERAMSSDYYSMSPVDLDTDPDLVDRILESAFRETSRYLFNKIAGL
jgi:hypothetical protein